jgi:ribonuclease PH
MYAQNAATASIRTPHNEQAMNMSLDARAATPAMLPRSTITTPNRSQPQEDRQSARNPGCRNMSNRILQHATIIHELKNHIAKHAEP